MELAPRARKKHRHGGQQEEPADRGVPWADPWRRQASPVAVIVARRSVSMPEVPAAGEHHRQAVLVGRGDHFGVAHRAAGLHDGRRAGGARPRRARRGTGRTRRRRPPIRAADRRAFITAVFTASTRLICPAPTASVTSRPGEDHGVRLHVRAHAPREPQRRPLLGASARAASRPRGPSCPGHGAPRFDDAIARLHEPRAQDRPHIARRVRGRRTTPSPRAGSAWSPESAAPSSASTRPGATTASMNVDVSARAVSTSIGRFRPTMPPNADSAIGLARADVGLGQRARRSPRRRDWCA